MKMKLLSTAVAAGLGLGLMSTAAQAVYVNPQGTGQVLLYPYYTSEGGYNTNVQVVNTSAVGKVVKVRFREAENSQEVLDFNLFLSPHDEWTGAVVNTANGAKLVTNDNTCTAPGNAAIKAGVDFRNSQYAGDKKSNGTVANDGLDRTREGYVEIIGEGDVPATIGGNANPLYAAILHGTNGVPANCSYVTSTATATLSGEMTALTGGLYGYATIVNVPNGTAATYDATALDQFYVPGTAPQYNGTGSVAPNLGSAASGATVFANGTVTNYTTANGWDAVSVALLASNLMNDYVVDPGLNAGTDWVVTFPTKSHYVNQTPAVAPFTTSWSTANSQACEPVNINYYDREEQTTSSPLDFSPVPSVQGASLCYEANVISFNGTDVLSATNTAYNLNLASGFTSGWADLDLVHNVAGTAVHAMQATDVATNTTVTLQGLPAIGFADIQFQNGNVGGLLSNYAGITAHKKSLGAAN